MIMTTSDLMKESVYDYKRAAAVLVYDMEGQGGQRYGLNMSLTPSIIQKVYRHFITSSFKSITEISMR